MEKDNLFLLGCFIGFCLCLLIWIYASHTSITYEEEFDLCVQRFQDCVVVAEDFNSQLNNKTFNLTEFREILNRSDLKQQFIEVVKNE